MSGDVDEEIQPSRYVVGIDLGTTNSAVCYVDTAEKPWQVRVLEIPQFVAPGQVEGRDTLPSFHWQPVTEGSGFGVQGSGNSYVVGFMARDYGGATPGRMIASAKSWLCHTGVDRTAELLPWHAAADVERISPVEASSRYLANIRGAWNERHKSEPLEQQDIVLTLPASFDEIARELTVEAAARAGLKKVVLIEEPQAAFYAWIYKHQENWEELVSEGQKILVCDIGGGTTDFTLIRVRKSGHPHPGPLPQGERGKVQFHRVAVGDHLLLGGDNMDLALAQHLEARLCGSAVKLEARQWDALLRVSRQVKEQLLADEGPEELTVTLPGSGSKLIGGALTTKVRREEVRTLLVEGFMPRVALDEKPAARRSGFQEFGLPYAADPGMTRYLGAFLVAHRKEGSGFGVQGSAGGQKEEDREQRMEGDPARPNVVLFNGGVFEAGVLRERLLTCLADWFGGENATGWQPVLLDNDRLDLAVARGAAYFGMVRRGEGVKIVASLARTYYIGVEGEQATALCLVPGSAEAGQEIEMPERQFDLRVSEPVEFPLYTSSIRLTDRPGEMVAVDPEQMTALPPIRTALKTRSRRERGTALVRLFAKLTEIGTLEVWCREVAGERTWRLQFDVRAATQTDAIAHESASEAEGVVDEATAESCRAVLEGTFGESGRDDPSALVKRLVIAAGSERQEWPTSLLRRIWEMLMEMEAGRRKSAAHEARWLNFLGYALRPGFGLAVDDWRVAETWKTVQGKLTFSAATSRTESLILWRRIAGGLPAGQQRALGQPLMAAVKAMHRRHVGGSQVADPMLSPHEAVEVLRLLGSLELLEGEAKIELGRMLVELHSKKKLAQIRPALAWAIGRIGAREPAYGPLNTVVPAAEAEEWINTLLAGDVEDAMAQFAIVNLARRTGDRFRDGDESVRERVLEWLEERGAGEHPRKLVQEGGKLATEEQASVFGDGLPKGLRVR